ncbi:MAG: DUF4278 domain-containing protein [Leptolyngbya sp. Prado105]|jgi:hypothetical protein|nr:DUF4278 domain-containing protein [Leptolyngbya sp. Prado105]
MKIFEFRADELELLQKNSENQILFQGKTFVKGVTISSRFHQQIVDKLRLEADHTTFCLIVEMEIGYIVWNEVKPDESVPDEALDLLLNDSEIAPLDPSKDPSNLPIADQSEDIATMIVPLVAQVIEAVLTQKKSMTLEQLTHALQPVISDPNVASELAEKLFTELEKSNEVESNPDPVRSRPILRKYRGISYRFDPQSSGLHPTRPIRRKYRGISY